jgi:hypothetical protein
MNPKFTLSITAGICFSVLAIHPYTPMSSATIEKRGGKEPVTKAATNYSSRNNHAVKIYPDVIRKAMHVVAKENNGKEIDFFVFDLQGVLMKHYRMNGRDREEITGLKRGKYIYHVFCGDEETASGKFTIR